MKNKRILVISDMHIPYHHKDSIKFLKEIKKEFKPDRIVNIGDSIDFHNISMHDSNPDLPSAGDELKMSIPIIFLKIGLIFHNPFCNKSAHSALEHTWVGVHSTFHLHHTLELYVLQLGSRDYNYRQLQIERLWCH